MANYKLDFTGEEVNELLHKVYDDDGGASSWNDLPDKPFGETTVTGDTLTWDGNIDTFVDASGGEGAGFIKLSDTVPTLDDLANGGIAVNSMGTFEFTHYIDGTEMLGMPCLVATNDSWEDGDTIMMCPLIFTADVDMGGVTIPKGVLAYYTPGQIEPVSWTVNGYTFTETKVKTIEGKFLEPFETVKVGTDTLTWDGNTKGLYKPADTESTTHNYHLVSNCTPTYEQLCNGGSVTLEYNGEIITETISSSNITGSGSINEGNIGEDWVLLPLGLGLVIYKPNVVYSTITFEKTGIYLSMAASLKINGYTFIGEQTKLKKEYAHPQVFFINGEGHYTNVTIDKTVAEILEAYNNGAMCYIVWNYRIIPLRKAVTYNGLGALTFEDVDISGSQNQVQFFTVEVSNMSDDYTLMEDTVTSSRKHVETTAG